MRRPPAPNHPRICFNPYRENQQRENRLFCTALVSPYAGSFTAVNAWYPARYEPADALRIGSMSFVFKAAGNLVGEFFAPPR
jgi:hypothetical protein